MNPYITSCLLAIVWIWGATEAPAQIEAPDFLCVQNDTLIWEMPNPSCGPVQGYEIYFSQQPDGPFNLLATINDPDSLSYFHNHLSDETFYYFIHTLANCPGEFPVPSDTLDNRPPEPPVIEAVSVVNGQVDIHWTPSVSPETIGYIIYRATSLGTVPIDTVYSGMNYTDSLAFPDQEEQYYYVLSLDACGNTSLFDITHHTIYTEATVDSCTQSAQLSWSLYENWGEGIRDHVVYLSENNGPEIPVDTLGPGRTSYTLTGLDDSTRYCITVEARENLSGESSRSNRLCFTPDIVEPMDFIRLLNASVTTAGEIQLRWSWDTDAELTGIILDRSHNGMMDQLQSFIPLQPLNPEQQFIDNTFSEYDGPHTYRIETRDFCDSVERSNEIKTIYLRGENGQGATNRLQWNAFESPLSTVVSYTLYSVSGGTTTAIATLPSDSLQYIHALDVTQSQNASLCYLVEARHRVDIPGQAPRTFYSRSNVVCLDQDVTVFVPNAFAPEGSNRFFKPVFAFPQNITEYGMTIFDRFGGEVFRTSNMDGAWYGIDPDGTGSPAGVYVYLIQWKTSNGAQREKRGTVLLIR